MTDGMMLSYHDREGQLVSGTLMSPTVKDRNGYEKRRQAKREVAAPDRRPAEAHDAMQDDACSKEHGEVIGWE
ncbi:MAG: hypothetical protein LQ340_006793 [Diploschistes diacapsis]|nr:MAG: hypothetical protein LQ340_006793 [Diploschistes diacapsis]